MADDTGYSPAPSALPSAGEVRELNARFATLGTPEILAWAWQRFGVRAGIGTSFQGAGLVMMHLAEQHGFSFPVFTIDTGLLFPETVILKDRLEAFFGLTIEVLRPDLSVAKQAEAMGPELWRHQPDQCCTLRKVLPLQARLAHLDCWITGLRRQQAETRADIGVVELHVADPDTGREIIKLNPMSAWRREEVWDYLHREKIPYNPLHDQGYRSIGCQPCTAKSGGGENERAGRWTGFHKTECGIHTFMARKA